MSGGPRPRDRVVRWRRACWVGGAGLVAYFAILLMARSPDLADAILGDGRASVPSRFLSRVTGAAPFSVAEVLVLAYVGWMGALAMSVLRDLVGRRRSLRNAAAGGVARGLRHGGLLVLMVYGLWGLNYARAGIDDRAGWPAWRGATVAELEQLSAGAVSYANSAYTALHGGEDAGAPTAFPEDPDELRSAVTTGWERVGTLFPDDDAAVSGRFGMVKRPWLSGLMARFGIAGVYIPLTGEAHVLRDLPAVSAVQGMAHEQAHQRGITNEAEASFAGFLANSLSEDPLARYSASVFAARQLLAALSRMEREAVELLPVRFVPGIRRDLEDLEAFWEPYRGLIQRIGSAINDRYLRANRVEGGVESYGRSSRLLIEYARQTGSLFPEAPSTQEASSGGLTHAGIGLDTDFDSLAAARPKSQRVGGYIYVEPDESTHYIYGIGVGPTGVRLAFERRREGERPTYPVCDAVQASLEVRYGPPAELREFSEEASERSDRYWRTADEELVLNCFRDGERWLAEAVRMSRR